METQRSIRIVSRSGNRRTENTIPFSLGEGEVCESIQVNGKEWLEAFTVKSLKDIKSNQQKSFRNHHLWGALHALVAVLTVGLMSYNINQMHKIPATLSCE